jgi:chemotaxis protein MotA
MPTELQARKRSKLDFSTIAGILLALGAIVGGLILEGGRISDIAQLTAALIVLGGTAGAVMITTPMDTLISAAGQVRSVFLDTSPDLRTTIEEIIQLATKARKQGIISLEPNLEGLSDPFLQKALGLVVDGADLHEIRKMMDLDILLEEKRAEADAKVFESAGGYAPTIGIIGAVMGLIQVMKHLENMEEVGHGIAVAFVATVYGVAAANIIFLPMAQKLKARMQNASYAKELMLEGVTSIAEGLNPKLIEAKLMAFIPSNAKPVGGAPSPVTGEVVSSEG